MSGTQSRSSTLALLGSVLWTLLAEDDGECYPRWIQTGDSLRLALAMTAAGPIWADTEPVEELAYTSRFNASHTTDLTTAVGDRPCGSKWMNDN